MEGDDGVAQPYAGLSVRAWLAVALRVTDAWFDRVGLAGPDTARFVNHLWQWMPMTGSPEMTWWESDIPEVEAVALYGAVDQSLMLRYLRDLEVIMGRYGLRLPDPAPFAASRFDQYYGWGKPLSAAELSNWRTVPLQVDAAPDA